MSDSELERLVQASKVELTQQLSHVAGQTNHSNSAPSVLSSHLNFNGNNPTSATISTVPASRSGISRSTSVQASSSNSPTVLQFTGSLSRPNVTSVIVGTNDVQEFI